MPVKVLGSERNDGHEPKDHLKNIHDFLVYAKISGPTIKKFEDCHGNFTKRLPL